MFSKAYVLETPDCLVYVARRVLVELFVVAEDDDGNVDRTQNRKLVRFLEKTTFALEECAVTNSQLQRAEYSSHVDAPALRRSSTASSVVASL